MYIVCLTAPQEVPTPPRQEQRGPPLVKGSENSVHMEPVQQFRVPKRPARGQRDRHQGARARNQRNPW